MIPKYILTFRLIGTDKSRAQKPLVFSDDDTFLQSYTKVSSSLEDFLQTRQQGSHRDAKITAEKSMHIRHSKTESGSKLSSI